MTTVYIKHGHVKPLLYRHPWVFASSVDRIEGEPLSGSVVDVRAPDGRFLARGFYSAESGLRVRSFAYSEGVEPDADWIDERIRAAVAYRSDVLGLPSEGTDVYRLVHGDADRLPGLVADRLGDVVALQITTAGLEARRQGVLDAIERHVAPRAIIECPDMGTRAKEGLGPVDRLQRGQVPEGGRARVREHGLVYEVDLVGSQKTGFFCDHRETRALVRRMAPGRRVLDAFCYTGAFALNAARAGAERVEAVDSSEKALALARRNAELNGLVVGFTRGDVYKLLAEWRAEGRCFDLVVLDPPKYARSRRDVGKALKKYRELFSLGASVTSPSGLLLACSCSGLLDDAAFEGVLREVPRTAGRDLRIVWRGGQAPDHPVTVTCPEGRYLRAYVCHVV